MPDDADVLTPAKEIQDRLDKLRITLDGEIPYRLESVFPKITGWGANGEIKRRAKLLKLVEPTLHRMLLTGEEVLYVSKGVQYSFAEQYFMGALWANLLNQTVFVLTNLRLLLMRSKSSGQPTNNFWVIYYSEIVELKSTWSGILQIKLQDGQQAKFTGFPKIDRKNMPSIFQDALDRYRKLGFHPPVSQSRETLCAFCFHVVPKEQFICSNCGAEFWTPKQLALRSLAFPSWGDFAMKHYGLAIMKLIGYLISWCVALANLFGPEFKEGLVIVAFIFLLEHPMDAMLSHTIAKKGLNPRFGPDPKRISTASGHDTLAVIAEDDDDVIEDLEEVS